MMIIILLIGVFIGFVGLSIFSGNAYEKGVEDGKKVRHLIETRCHTDSVERLQKDNERLNINRNYFENKSMNLDKALAEANERIRDLEEVAQVWIKQSLEESKKLIKANERIRLLEGGHEE
ncbi:hypothetical protein [Neobacillus drentensis]|uniref:hypothetical protein n=1 Tax=Neobacillus drentensis TaxID=220684 RepID=UPI0030000A1E